MAEDHDSLTLDPTEEEEEEEEDEQQHSEEDEEELELQVNQMAEQIRHYRTAIPEKINQRLGSLLSSLRPILPSSPSSLISSDPGVALDQIPDFTDAGENPESSEGTLAEEKLRLIKLKFSSNLSAMPVVLRTMNDAIARIDKLGTENGDFHPVFKRKKTLSPSLLQLDL